MKKARERNNSMRRFIVSGVTLLAGLCISSASVTVQGWWHLDSTQPITDSSGNNRAFGSAYSTAPATGGQVAAQVINNGAGGPLDGTGYTSRQCIQVGVGVGGKRQSSMWAIGYNPPAQNYGIEIWVLPQDNGIAGGSGGWILSSGQSGGVALRINQSTGGGSSYIDAIVLGSSAPIGYQVPIDTNNWMHLAIVNDAGATTFYTNGVACGPSNTNSASTPAGDVYCISAPGDNQAFYGYLDEARMFTFAAGAFSTNDLLLRPAGPQIITQPLSASVWDGGAVSFSVTPSFAGNISYQWQSRGTNVPGATGSSIFVPSVSSANSGNTYDCVLTSGSISATTTVATLTVVEPNPADVNAYRSLVTSESSLVAYYPVDDDTGNVVTNTVNASFNGSLELNATYDSRTNNSFGQRALSFNFDGDVQIPNNPAFEFAGGQGTIEALVYLSQAAVSPPTFFSEGFDPTSTYYALQFSGDGGFLRYTNDNNALTWAVPGGAIGQWLHVAFVFDHGTNITPYINGRSLGTQVQTGFGSGVGAPAWIGSIGTAAGVNTWGGAVDELAIYSTALTASDIQSHYTKLVYGTNVAPPVIVSQPASKTLLAGGSPTLVVAVGGALPFTFQWTSNGVPIAGATSASLTLPQTTTNSSATYSLSVGNAFGTTNTEPIILTFQTPPAGYVGRVMADNPTALWRLADTAGPTAVDSAGLYDGTYSSSGVTYAAGGFPGDPAGGAVLDGSTGRAVVPNTPALNPSGPFTIEFWGQLASYGFFIPVSSMNRPSRDSGYEFYIDGNAPGYEFHTAAGGGYNMICTDGNVPPNAAWYHVAGVWDTTNIYLYVNGQLGNQSSEASLPNGVDNWVLEGAPPFVPNTAEPFYIGCRSDNTHFWHGALSDVAFYSYALTPNQISNHWSYGWVPSSVVQSPSGVTNVEGSTVTLTPTVKGTPNTYRWYKNGTALTASLNFDGTPHYSQDVTNVNLVISEAVPSDSGQYHLVIANPVSGSTSADASVLITPDTTPPAVESVTALGTPSATVPEPYLVKVSFNKRVDPGTAGDSSHYVISPTVTIASVTVPADVSAAAFGSDYRTAFLVTDGLVPGQKYSVTVSGVKDQAQTPNTIVAAASAFQAPTLTQGVLAWDYYYLGSVSDLASLTGNANYPNAPQTNATLTVFDTDEITGGDLNNNPAFGATFGDNYGDSLSGWITPTVSGDYTFFIASDDASELHLSTDSNPLNAQVIAVETGCCHGFQEPGAPTTSMPITLKAGTNYFIQALHTEGGGGDYVKVAWRISTDSTASTNLPPIQAQYLSTYAPVSTQPGKFNAPVFSGGQVTLSWTGPGRLYQSTDLKNWTLVPGSPASPFPVTPSAGTAYLFYRLGP